MLDLILFPSITIYKNPTYIFHYLYTNLSLFPNENPQTNFLYQLFSSDLLLGISAFLTLIVPSFAISLPLSPIKTPPILSEVVPAGRAARRAFTSETRAFIRVDSRVCCRLDTSLHWGGRGVSAEVEEEIGGRKGCESVSVLAKPFPHPHHRRCAKKSKQ